jgi:hypothetical protein
MNPFYATYKVCTSHHYFFLVPISIFIGITMNSFYATYKVCTSHHFFLRERDALAISWLNLSQQKWAQIGREFARAAAGFMWTPDRFRHSRCM